jgi:hypothetical protein
MENSLDFKPEEVSAHKVWDEYNDYSASARQHKAKYQESYDFYNGRQWPKEWADQLVARGQFPLVVSKVYPIIQQMLSTITANRPQYKFFPRNEDDRDLARAQAEAASYIWDRSNGDMHFSRAVRDMLVGGIGHVLLNVDRFSGEPRFKRINPLDVFVDPASEELDFSDAASIIIRKVVTKRSAIRSMPEHEELIKMAPVADRETYSKEFASNQSGIYSSNNDLLHREDVSIVEDQIELLERYARETIRNVIVTDPSGQPYTMSEKQFEEWYQTVEDPEAFQIGYDYKEIIRVTQTISNREVLGDYIIPSGIYPIISFVDNHNDNPYPEGEVEHIKGLSMERNKRRSLMIHNATTSSNSKWLVEDGSIDEGEWENNSSVPGAVLKYRQGFTPPQPIFPQQIPQALMNLEDRADRDMEYVTGIYSVMQGDAASAPATYKATLAMDEYGARRIKLKMRQVGLALGQLGRCVMKFNQMFLTSPKILQIIQQDGKEGSIMINTKDPESGNLFNDLSRGDYDVIVREGSTLPTNRMAHLEMALDLFKYGIYDDIAVMKKLDDPDIDEIIERKSQLSQVAQQNEGLQKANQEMEGKVKNLSQQVEALMRQIRVEKSTKQIDAKVVETRAKLNSAQKDFDNQQKFVNKEAGLKVKALQDSVNQKQRERDLDDQQVALDTSQSLMGNLDQPMPVPE